AHRPFDDPSSLVAPHAPAVVGRLPGAVGSVRAEQDKPVLGQRIITMPRIGYEVKSVGLYTRLYFDVKEPARMYLIDKIDHSITVGGVGAAEGPLGHDIEDSSGWTCRSLLGSELSVAITRFGGISRT